MFVCVCVCVCVCACAVCMSSLHDEDEVVQGHKRTEANRAVEVLFWEGRGRESGERNPKEE